MTKSLKELSTSLLGKFLGRSGRPVYGRISSPPDLKSEEATLASLRVRADAPLANGKSVCEYELHGDRYIAININLSDDAVVELRHASSETVERVSIENVVFLFLAHRMHLKSLPVNENWVDEYIAGPAESPDGVELSCLKDRIEPITIFQIQPDSIFSENFSIDRIAHYIMTFDDKYSKAGALSTASLSLIRELFVKERQHLAAHALFNTLSATSTRQSFFESYRALEFLFVLPHARALLGELAKVGSLPNLTAMGLAQTCYKHLGWKRVDRDSIRKLFAEFYDSSLLSFKKVIANATPFKSLVLPSANPDADDKSAFIDKFTDSYYSLRNQVVHCQWDEISLDDDEWRSIVDFTLACIHHIYDKHLSVPVGTANPMSP